MLLLLLLRRRLPLARIGACRVSDESATTIRLRQMQQTSRARVTSLKPKLRRASHSCRSILQKERRLLLIPLQRLLPPLQLPLPLQPPALLFAPVPHPCSVAIAACSPVCSAH